MNYYEIWCDLKDGRRDLEFVQAVQAYLGYLRDQRLLADFRIARRKLGFGPPHLGEFHISLMTESLAQLDAAFSVVATRAAPVEALHARVYALAVNIHVGLYRDFPDADRGTPIPQPQ